MEPEISGPCTVGRNSISGLVSLNSFPIFFPTSTTRQEGPDHVIHDSGRPAPALRIPPLPPWTTAPADLQSI